MSLNGGRSTAWCLRSWVGVRFLAYSSLFCLALIGSTAAAGEQFYYGVGVHFPSYRSTMEVGLGAMKAAGFNSYRDDIHWGMIEKNVGEFKYSDFYELPVSFSEKNGLSPILILGRMSKVYKWADGYSSKPITAEKRRAFSNYSAEVVRHYKGRVSLFELWNEWNQSGGEPKGPAPYLELLKEVAPAVKAANPDALLLLGSSNVEGLERTWLPVLLAGGVNDLVDGYSIHPYVHCERGRKATPEGWFEWLSALLTRYKLAVGGKIKPFYITEMSWPANEGPCGVSEQIQAVYLAKLFILSPFVPNVKGLWWYDLQNDGRDRSEMEHNFGLLDFDLKPKDAYRVARVLVPELVGKSHRSLKQYGKLWIARFGNNAGGELFCIWQEGSRSLQLQVASGVEPVSTVRVPEGEWREIGRESVLSIGTEPVMVRGAGFEYSVLENGKLIHKFGPGF